MTLWIRDLVVSKGPPRPGARDLGRYSMTFFTSFFRLHFDTPSRPFWLDFEGQHGLQNRPKIDPKSHPKVVDF